jgi:hypothetical protein
VNRRKPRRATGTRTMVDVIRGLTRGSIADQKRADLEAVQGGGRRLVRCYTQPEPGEHRRHWKPGYLDVSVDELQWKGSSRRWKPLVLRGGQWKTHLRNATRDDRVYRSFGIIECDRGSERHVLAVPKRDVDLCVSMLKGS